MSQVIFLNAVCVLRCKVDFIVYCVEKKQDKEIAYSVFQDLVKQAMAYTGLFESAHYNRRMDSIFRCLNDVLRDDAIFFESVQAFKRFEQVLAGYAFEVSAVMSVPVVAAELSEREVF
ncbi:hypothetical protein [Methylomonas koyamae]|uniref:hypothetical protein n=1 Tax=Methylomonas koyamae TaxID=702114 RepID=UPI0028735287|nr:hypothetical protein [Methylomonas koyamae]WNB77572.1 hypothetical protein RI210_08310 [Methylomonas koyamae]